MGTESMLKSVGAALFMVVIAIPAAVSTQKPVAIRLKGRRHAHE